MSEHKPMPDAAASLLSKLAWSILYEFTAQSPERGGFGPEDVVRAEKQLEESIR